MRAFLGIALPERALDALDEAGVFLRDNDPRWTDAKWVPRQNLHVTVAFLGNVEPTDADILVGRLAARFASIGSPRLAFEEIQAIPSLRSARMVWAIFKDIDGVCARLAAESFDEAATIGVAPSDREFSAHATLVRSRGRMPLDTDICREATRRAKAAFLSPDRPMSDPSGIFDVRSVTLFASTLARTGPVYSKVHELAVGS